MKEFWKGFFFRGCIAAAGGPVVLAIIYGILGLTGAADSLAPGQVCMGILTVTLLAFTVAGLGAVYQIEKLPLSTAILIHGAGLYIVYIFIYLMNGWLKQQLAAIGIFTGIFIAGYALIWLGIYLGNRARARRLNSLLDARKDP